MIRNNIRSGVVLLAVIVSILGLHSTPASASPLGSCDPTAPATITYNNPSSGTWVVLDDEMTEGLNDCFTGTLVGSVTPGVWQWTSTAPVVFDITDLFIVSDQFKVYDFGAEILTTPSKLDWYQLGYDSPFSTSGGTPNNDFPLDSSTYPPYTRDPNVAFASDLFSHASYIFGAGAHAISIRDIHIPAEFCFGGPDASGNCPGGTQPSPDGSVAFRLTGPVEPVQQTPEPISLVLFGSGATIIGFVKKRRARAKIS